MRRPFFLRRLATADSPLSCSLAEETKDPSRTVPWAIVFANVFTYVGGFLFNIVLVFCMGDPKALLSSRVGQPVRQATDPRPSARRNAPSPPPITPP